MISTDLDMLTNMVGSAALQARDAINAADASEHVAPWLGHPIYELLAKAAQESIEAAQNNDKLSATIAQTLKQIGETEAKRQAEITDVYNQINALLTRLSELTRAQLG
jgi:hypothetical protein